MQSDMPNFRSCFGDLGTRPSREHLLAWADRLLPVMERLQRYAPATARALTGKDTWEDLWELYALSRVNDRLLVAFQPDRPDAMLDISKSANSAEVYQVFWEALDMRLLAPRQFHPFFHEIMAVVQAADPDEPISVLEMRWPALMFGDLLVSRARWFRAASTMFVRIPPPLRFSFSPTAGATAMQAIYLTVGGPIHSGGRNFGAITWMRRRSTTTSMGHWMSGNLARRIPVAVTVFVTSLHHSNGTSC